MKERNNSVLLFVFFFFFIFFSFRIYIQVYFLKVFYYFILKIMPIANNAGEVRFILLKFRVDKNYKLQVLENWKLLHSFILLLYLCLFKII